MEEAMNQQNLDILFRNYIDHFEELNNHEHDEKYKWNAVGHVQKTWNLEAEDLSGMIKEAFSRCFELIDNRFVHPTSGMVKLAQLETDAVRKAFSGLLADDDGDLENRQNRILLFVDTCNALLQKHFPGTWKYVQDVRSAIAYLAAIKPEENYLFKSTPAREFARYMEYGDEIGQGANFKLSSYYRMCDQLVDHMRQCPELLEKDRSRRLITKWKDPSLHVLAYDLIYCFDTYGLSEGMKEPPVQAKSTGSQQREYRKEQTRRIQAELESIQDQIDKLQAEIASLPVYDFTGQMCKTRAFGIVQIQGQQGNHLHFEVKGQLKTFALPGCVAAGFLIPADENVIQRYKMEVEIRDKVRKLEDKQKPVFMELNKYQN